ncbi:hypothetical protein EDB86DRAFT_3045713 [Lactarius hatsudake]|nr:hypothetical protein EDB86DRAFT_3045713 [Lactarius hatsudake]
MPRCEMRIVRLTPYIYTIYTGAGLIEHALATELVLGVIERQRRDQERMLRTLANGESPSYHVVRKQRVYTVQLTDVIRGERLRFVEAMKEATAINVQIHVEEFKKDLTRDVLVSTQEVDRLQRERQLLERQIVDLFAFYSKRKQTTLGDAVPQSQPSQPKEKRLVITTAGNSVAGQIITLFVTSENEKTIGGPTDVF